jgi:hypothetical protein
MQLPSGGHATVDDAKVRDYLLSSTHPVGRFKAGFYLSLGYSVQNWQVCRDMLLQLACSSDAVSGRPSPFGQKFEIRADVKGPSGRTARIVTVWMISTGAEHPHFVTAYPG